MSQKAHEGAVPIWPGPRWLRSHIPRSPRASGGEIMSVCSQPGVSWGATSPGARGGSTSPAASHLLSCIPVQGFQVPQFLSLTRRGSPGARQYLRQAGKPPLFPSCLSLQHQDAFIEQSISHPSAASSTPSPEPLWDAAARGDFCWG